MEKSLRQSGASASGEKVSGPNIVIAMLYHKEMEVVMILLYSTVPKQALYKFIKHQSVSGV